MEQTTFVDNMETTADNWKGWSVEALDGTQVSLSENSGMEFTKQDFEKALKKVSRKVKK